MSSKTDFEEKIKKYDEVGDFEEGFAPVKMRVGKRSIVKGFINESGDEIAPLKYHVVCWFSEGMAAVCIIKGRRRQWGYVNTSGQEVIPQIYEEAFPFTEGLAMVKLNG
ncbi:MAG: WG repeat-containing protein, partial [Odoribacteraceae bacterium]|nr:WG repeat-containing protein [Odoribacteraceae bacterium]